MSIASIIDRAKTDGRKILTEVESKDILEEAGIPTARARLATTADEAVAAAREVGFPVALKAASPDITHKSDVGGVKLNLTTPDEVKAAFDEIIAAAKRAQPDAKIDGVSVQKMARPGIEVIMGMSQDAQFGPVLMFGLGGILVEVLKDVSFRLVPITPRDARQMVQEIKGRPLLEGYRGQEPADVEALEKLLLRLSDFIEKHPEIAELDLNPIFAYKDGAVAVDARIILS
ncbi:MAG: acetate--CoA ligase family protein [Dehalococcoidia bacterium]|nr:acetate--CoA ligase family protein [Dehalococcoidia bacterium]